jgi:hypothetical protein
MKRTQLFWTSLLLVTAVNSPGFAQQAGSPNTADSTAAPGPTLTFEDGQDPGADQPREAGKDTKNERLTDLTLANFFTAGWDESDRVKRERASGTPDFALLRVQTNFMEREVRVNYFYESNINSPIRANLNNADAFIAYAFNHRFMLEVFGNYQWFDDRKGPDVDGGAPRIVGRVQLIDTELSSYTFNCQVVAPDRGIGQTQTTFSYGLAGFEDLAPILNLDRVGLYSSVLFDSLAGTHAPGAVQNDVSYDITVAKTLTRPETPLIGDFTVFVENFAQTNLDGAVAGRTLVEITPGVRFNLGKSNRVRFGNDNWILAGVDIPVAGPRPYDAIYRLSYIKNF